MRFLALLSAVPLLLAAFAAAPAQAAGPVDACVGAYCPPGYLACVVPVDPRLGFCVQDPTLYCFDVVWLDQRVGPYHVWGTGCTIHIEEEGGWDVLA